MRSAESGEIRHRGEAEVGAVTWMAAVGGGRMNYVRGGGKYVGFASPTDGTDPLVCIRRDSVRCFVRRYRNTLLRAVDYVKTTGFWYILHL